MKYPYIGQFQHAIKLFYGENRSTLIKEGHGSNRHESKYTNITHEYLQNTWGVVESKEHAEFIVELAVNGGVRFTTGTNEGHPCWFAFDDELYFFKSKEYASYDRKQITIPLPPKEPLKNAGDNLILGCEESWPQSGDKVCWSNGKRNGELKSICEGWAWIKDDGGEFVSLMAKFIQKPKTPEEELRDDLINSISSCFVYISGMLDKSEDTMKASHQAACNLISKYNITKKTQYRL